MVQAQSPGVQKHPPTTLARQFTIEFEFAVFVVAQNRVTGAGQVHPDLVRAAGLDGDLQQRGALRTAGQNRNPPGHAHQCERLLTVRIFWRGHAHAPLAIGQQEFVQGCVQPGQPCRPVTADQRQIGLAGLARPELILQLLQCTFLFGNQQQAAGFAVEPVHQFEQAGGGPAAAQLFDHAETHAAANILGRQSVLRVVRFLKKDPVFAFLKIERLQPETGVRETYRIVGETTVTEADYREGRVFADAVSHSFYPIDLHVDGRIVPDHLKEGIVPTVPRSALIPKGSKNLMVAGRCISSDRMANSALRVQASCMGMGQAAGVTAA